MKELIEPIGVLMKILTRHTDKGKRRPKMFPGTVREAAQYWIEHQETPDDYKEGVTKIIKNGELIGYETPYHDRLERTLRKFLTLSPLHQAFVIDSVDKGVPWRGDEIHIYTNIVKEGFKFLADPEAYKDKHAAIMQGFHE